MNSLDINRNVASEGVVPSTATRGRRCRSKARHSERTSIHVYDVHPLSSTGCNLAVRTSARYSERGGSLTKRPRRGDVKSRLITVIRIEQPRPKLLRRGLQSNRQAHPPACLSIEPRTAFIKVAPRGSPPIAEDSKVSSLALRTPLSTFPACFSLGRNCFFCISTLRTGRGDAHEIEMIYCGSRNSRFF